MSRIITVSSDTSFLIEMSKVWLTELQQDSRGPDAPESLRRDWGIVAKWLDHASNDLSDNSLKKFEKAWMAYIAIGVAPSLTLQPIFDDLARKIGEPSTADRAPTEVMDVFDRLLATDKEIELKRALDLEIEKAKLRQIFDEFNCETQKNWWRRKPLVVRKWLFLSFVWMGFITLYSMFFDPFGAGGWESMDEEHTTRFYIIMMAPMGIGAITYAYQRWVK